MKFLKGCATSILCILIFIFSGIAFSVLAMKATFLDSKVISDLIDKIDFQEVIPMIIEQAIPEDAEEQSPISEESIKEMLDNIRDEDWKLIKDTAKDVVVKFYAFMNGETESFETEVDLTQFAPMIANALSSSPETLAEMGLPFEICENDTSNCIQKDDFSDLLSKGLAGELSSDDILAIFPQCPTGYFPPSNGELPECIPAGATSELKVELDKLLEDSNLNANLGTGTSEQEGPIPQSVTLSSKDFPQEIFQARDILNTYVKPAPYVLLGVTLILILFVFLIQKVNGLMWVGVLSILEGLLLASGKVTSEATQDIAITQFEIQVPELDPAVIEKVLDLLLHFMNYLNNLLAVIGLGLIGVGALLIFAWSMLKKKEEKEVVVKDLGVDTTPEHLPAAAKV